MNGLIIIPPIHSIIQPTVGVGYLKAYLKEKGLRCKTLDLNIELFSYLKRRKLDNSLLELVFPTGSRKFGGELLMSSLLFPEHKKQMLAKLEAAFARAKLKENVYILSMLKEGKKLIQHLEYAKLQYLVNQFIDRAVESIIKQNYSWISFSVVVTNLLSALLISKRIKRISPGIKIIYGGPHCNIEVGKQLIANFRFIDLIVYGEGQQTLSAAVDAIVHNQDLSNIKATIVRNSGKVTVNSPRAQIDDIDSLPFADWTDFPLAKYHCAGVSFDKSKPVIPIHTTSGCSHNKCSFCYNVSLWPQYYSRSPESVIKEMEFQAKTHNTNQFFFTDFDFNAELDRVNKICNLLIRRSLHFRYSCWIRADNFEQNLLHKMYQSGCREIFIGIEAVDTNLLHKMQKGYDTQRALRTLSMLHKFCKRHDDFWYDFNLIVLHPGEEVKSVKNTLKIISKNIELFRGRRQCYFHFMLNRNTHVFNNPKMYGIKILQGISSILFPARFEIPSYLYFFSYSNHDELKLKRELWKKVFSLFKTDMPNLLKDYWSGMDRDSLCKKYHIPAETIELLMRRLEKEIKAKKLQRPIAAGN